MSNIDTSAWKEFKVKDLFDIHPTKAYNLNNSQLLDGGENPVLANSRYNNGIGGFSSLDTTENGNMITFSDIRLMPTPYFIKKNHLLAILISKDYTKKIFIKENGQKILYYFL